MPEGDKPTIVRSYDNAKLRPDGSVTETTVVRFMYGSLGPFEVEVPRDTSKEALDEQIAKRLEPFGYRRY